MNKPSQILLVTFIFVSFVTVYMLDIKSVHAYVSESILFQEVNHLRIEHGLPELVINEQLEKAAALKAEDMIRYSYFAHTSPKSTTPWHWINLSGYQYVSAGENLATNFTSTETLLNAWMNSPSHKANIFKKGYTDTGYAVVTYSHGGTDTTLVVQLFGKPLIKKNLKAY